LTESVENMQAGSPRERALRDLLRAAERGDVDVVRAVLDDYPDVINERGTLEGHAGRRTALHVGVHHVEVVRTLLERGADPNIRDEGDNAFPLHLAAERGDLPMVKLLVEHGAQTTAGEVDDHGLDIIGWATVFPGIEIKPDVVGYLLAHGARHTLHSAVAVGDVNAIRLRAHEDPSALERPLDIVNRRRRALHLAVVKKQPASLEALLDLGADPDAEDAGGLTPLDEAALAGETAMVEKLLRRGAHLTLASAVALGRMDDAAKLLEADPGAFRPGGRWGTLIVKAAANAPGHVIDALVRLGASVDVSETPATSIDGTHGYTALHAAAYHGNVEALEALLKHGARTTARDSRHGGTPLNWARYARRDAIVERLLQAELDIFDAIDFDRPDRVLEILDKDPDAVRRSFGSYLPPGPRAPWCPDPEVTPLAWATELGREAMVRLLSERESGAP
jgi:ankyrin repeat protein